MATVRVALENGETAMLRDPKLLTNGERRPIILASDRWLKSTVSPEIAQAWKRLTAQKLLATNDVAREEAQAKLLELSAAAQVDQDETAVRKTFDVVTTVMVESWTLALPLPSEKPQYDDEGMLIGSEVLDDLLARDYDRLQRAAAQILDQCRYDGEDEVAPKARRVPQDHKPRKAAPSRASKRR